MRNIFRILDEGEIKHSDLLNMKYPSIYENFLLFTEPEIIVTHEQSPDKHPKGLWNEFHSNGKYKQPEGWVKWLKDLLQDYIQDNDWAFLRNKYDGNGEAAFYPRFCRELKKQHIRKEVEEYTGVQPFYPCVMINISPNWKDKLGIISKEDDQELVINKFKRVIETYLHESNRWSKWAYAIESGSEGSHLHAHIVAEVNPDLINSVLDGKGSHINKGNHTQQIRKIWGQVFEDLPWKTALPRGPKGKYSIQRVVLRTELLKDDKLEYLINEKKPEGHKNKFDLKILERRGL